MIELAVNLSLILFHLTPVTFLFLALLVALSAQKAWYARIWVAFCCTTATAWGLAIVGTLYIHTTPEADIITRVALCFGALSAFLYYAFYLSYLRLMDSHKLRLRLLALSIISLFGFFLFTPFFQQRVIWNAHQHLMQPQPGPLMPLYGLFVLYIFIYAVYQSYRAFRTESGHKRLQLRYFHIGTIVAMLAGIGSLLPFTSFRAFWVWIPSALTLSFPVLLSYVVVRHRLWDIRTVLHKTTLWLIVSVSAVLPVYLLLTYSLQLVQKNQSIFLLAISIALYGVLLLLVRKLQPWIDGLFSRRHFTQRQVVDTFVAKIRHLQQTRDLAQTLDETLREKMNISHARILITNKAGRYYYDAMGSMPPESRLFFDSTEELDSSLNEGKTSNNIESKEETFPQQSAPPWFRSWLIQQDCAIDLTFVETTALTTEKKAQLEEFFALRETVVMLPLLHNQELIGLIELGEKSNLRAYNQGDFELLERIRGATEVAMNNAQLYQELDSATEDLRMLTASLELRVQQRTQALEKAVQELEQAYEKLRKLNHIQSRFFTNITHELRTPLTLILAPLEDQLMQTNDLPDTLKPTLQIMHRQAIQLYGLINDLLDFARIDAKALRLKVRKFSFEAHLRSVLSSFEALAHRKNIKLSLEISEQVSPLFGDSEKIDRVLINLLGNALKFTPSGGQVMVRLYENSEHLVCEVEDTGIGIPKEQQEHIFDRFAQVEDGDDRTFEGTGLGLALVRELVQYHQGTIEVESEPNQGTRFKVNLRKGSSHFPLEAMERRKEHVPTIMTRRASDRDPLSDLSLSKKDIATRSATERPPRETPQITPAVTTTIKPTATTSALHHRIAADTSTPTTTMDTLEDVPTENLMHPLSTVQPESHSETLLPRSVGSHQDTASKEYPCFDSEVASSSTSTLMIVEDNFDMRQYLQSILQPHYNLLVASNGREALQLLERSHPDLIISDVMMPHLSGYELCQKVKKNAETAGIPVILLTANKGAERTFEGFQAGADDYLTKPFNSRELLARAQVQLKLKRMGQQLALQEKVSLLGLLSTGLAHEVKNPANAIMNSVPPLRLLTESLSGEDQDDVVELLDTILESADRIFNLCEDLLGLATTETEGIFPWQLEHAIDVTLRILRHNHQHVVNVEHDLQHQQAPEGFRSQLNQVLLNLISNALNAVGPDGHIWISTASDDTMFYLTLKDDGMGIKPKNLPHIFDPLFTTAEAGKGTGLGLYLIKRVVDNHGGTIRVESIWGEGTTFFVMLPLKPLEGISPLSPLSKAIIPDRMFGPVSPS